MLIRHGQTGWNRTGRYQGRSDPPLSLQGLQQARELGERLTSSGAHSLISSPLRRAHDTALCVGRYLHLEVDLDQRLSELSYGVWEGLTQAEVRKRWPDALRRWKQRPDIYPPAAGESLPEAAVRIRQCLDDLALHASTPVIAVTHAGVIRIARLLAEGGALADFRHLSVGNADTVTINWVPHTHH